MTKRNNSSPGAKRLQTLAAKTREQKERFLEQLRKYPIVETAASKTGIGRSTYYAWRNRDKRFAQAADQAVKESVAFVNDMAESQIIRGIKDGNMTATIFWLKSRHPAFIDRRRYEHEHEIVPRKFTEDEQVSITRALINLGLKNVIKTDKRIMRKAEEEQAKADRSWHTGARKPIGKSGEEPDEDPEGV